MAQDTHSSQLKELSDWLVGEGLVGTSQAEILEGYCQKIQEAGVPLMRLHMTQRAYHPEYGGFGFDWHRDQGMARQEYEHRSAPNQDWLNSPLYKLMTENRVDLRQRLDANEMPYSHSFYDRICELGARDYYAMKVRFEPFAGSYATDPMDPAEGMLISWATDCVDGFSNDHIALLQGLMPSLGLALKSAANRQMAQDIVRTYLGADAGERVLSGSIRRGSSETIHAVIWNFDLRGFTKLSEQLPSEAVIELLNAYFAVLVEVIESQGGNVLKFMGDGLLAIFEMSDNLDGVNNAAEAAVQLETQIQALNQSRTEQDLPTTDYTLALHLGDLSYGNIGGVARLDFTIIGPAVNATARFLGMCGPLDQKLIFSAQIAEKLTTRKDQAISLGRFMLRGMAQPQELFTLYLGNPNTGP